MKTLPGVPSSGPSTGTLILLGVGAVGLFLFMRRKKAA